MDSAPKSLYVHDVEFLLNAPFQFCAEGDRKFYTVALESAQWVTFDGHYTLFLVEFDDAKTLRAKKARWCVTAAEVAAQGAARGMPTPSSVRADLPFNAVALRNALDMHASHGHTRALSPRRAATGPSLHKPEREALYGGFPQDDKVKLNAALHKLADVVSSIPDPRIELTDADKVRLEKEIKTLARRVDFFNTRHLARRVDVCNARWLPAGAPPWHAVLSPHMLREFAALVEAEERHYGPVVHEYIDPKFSCGSSTIVENWDDFIAEGLVPFGAPAPVLSASKRFVPGDRGIQLWATPGAGSNAPFLVARSASRSTEAKFEGVVERLMQATVHTGSALFSTDETYVTAPFSAAFRTPAHSHAPAFLSCVPDSWNRCSSPRTSS